MAQEIINSLRSSSIIRLVDPATYSISLANLSSNVNETITSASIKRVMWSTNGSIIISRNSEPTMSLYNSGAFELDHLGYVLSNNSNQSISITINTGGTVFLEVSKHATYANALIGM